MLSTHLGKLAAAAGAALVAVASGTQPPAATAQGPDPVDYHKEIEPLLEKHCFKCHGDRKQKGDMQLNVLDPKMGTRADAEGWHAALDVINAGEMPPEDEAQPTDAERRKLVGWLTESLALAADRQKGERTVVLRRLTREQYTNSLQDLLGVSIDFAQTLPEDGKAKNGFSNNGEVLQASPLHLDNYQKIAMRRLRNVFGIDAYVTGGKKEANGACGVHQ